MANKYLLPTQKVKLSQVYSDESISDEAVLEFNRLTEDECFQVLDLLEKAQTEADKGMDAFKKRYAKIKEILKARYVSGRIEGESGMIDLPAEDFVDIFRPTDYAKVATFLVQ